MERPKEIWWCGGDRTNRFAPVRGQLSTIPQICPFYRSGNCIDDQPCDAIKGTITWDLPHGEQEEVSK